MARTLEQRVAEAELKAARLRAKHARSSRATETRGLILLGRIAQRAYHALPDFRAAVDAAFEREEREGNKEALTAVLAKPGKPLVPPAPEGG